MNNVQKWGINRTRELALSAFLSSDLDLSFSLKICGTLIRLYIFV